MKENKQELPKWFKGATYDEGEVVENIFTGQSIELNNIELSMYDFVMGANMTLEHPMFIGGDEIVRDLRKGLSWFRQNNAEAYMVLLD
mgnify:FL=1|tara:strand:+ start:277 stop:540 length:264 start_codon:yes stop_codon:yes gene_type:complete